MNCCGLRRIAVLLLLCSACSSQITESAPDPSTTSEPTPTSESSVAPAVTSTTDAASTSTSSSTSSTLPVVGRTGSSPPAWLGSIELELRPGEDNGIAQPTPPELIDRQLWTVDVLEPPPGDTFSSNITSPPPDDVIARSSWSADCPVTADELSYVRVSFVGFDGLFHTGELLVHRNFGNDIVEIFEALHEMRFPIEEMRVTTQEAVDAAPTGDSNNTSSFVCRPAVNSRSWSRHALGAAVDINPFHNPYIKGDLVIPELATAYLDRDRIVPGMITPEIEALFSNIGWGWGGDWSSASDWMHFSDSGG